MNLLLCKGKNKAETWFQYTFRTDPHDGPEDVFFTVTPVTDPCQDIFNFSLSVVGSEYLKVTMMNANKQAIYSGKGIPEALIHEAGLLFSKTIISSSNGKVAGEFRTESAEKVWKRLESQGLAIYNEENDFYTYTGLQGKGKVDAGYTNYDFEEMGFLQSYIDMPFAEMVKIKPVWDDNYEPEKYEIIAVPFADLLDKVDFLELRTDNIFNYLTSDFSYAEILKRWEAKLPVSPGILSFSGTEKLSFIDGRHRTLLAGILLNETVPVAVQKEFKSDFVNLFKAKPAS